MNRLKRAAASAKDKGLPGLLVAAFVVVTLGIDGWAAWNLGTAPWATAIFVTIALAGGTYKCLALTKIRDAAADGHWRRVAMLWMLLLVAWTQSVVFEATFYAQLYGDSATMRQAQIDYSRDIRAEKAQIEARLAKRETARSPEEIERNIDLELARTIQGRTVGRLTANCTATRRYDYRHCATVLELRGELASAKKIAEDDARLREIREGKAWVTRVGEAHSGASFIARLYQRVTGREIDAKTVLDALMLLGLAMVQLFSTVLPYAVFTNTPRPAIGPGLVTGLARDQVPGPGAVDAKLGVKVSGAAGSEMASDGARGDEPAGMPAGTGTVAGVRGSEPPRERGKVEDGPAHARPRLPAIPPRVFDFFPPAGAGQASSIALTAATGEAIGPDDIEAFVARYIDFGKGASEAAADVYRVYSGVVGPGLAHGQQTFLRGFRKTLPKGAGSRKVNGYYRFHGLQLNAAGRQLFNELRKEKHTLQRVA